MVRLRPLCKASSVITPPIDLGQRLGQRSRPPTEMGLLPLAGANISGLRHGLIGFDIKHVISSPNDALTAPMAVADDILPIATRLSALVVVISLARP